VKETPQRTRCSVKNKPKSDQLGQNRRKKRIPILGGFGEKNSERGEKKLPGVVKEEKRRFKAVQPRTAQVKNGTPIENVTRKKVTVKFP